MSAQAVESLRPEEVECLKMIQTRGPSSSEIVRSSVFIHVIDPRLNYWSTSLPALIEVLLILNSECCARTISLSSVLLALYMGRSNKACCVACGCVCTNGTRIGFLCLCC